MNQIIYKIISFAAQWKALTSLMVELRLSERIPAVCDALRPADDTAAVDSLCASICV